MFLTLFIQIGGAFGFCLFGHYWYDVMGLRRRREGFQERKTDLDSWSTFSSDFGERGI